VILSTRPTLDVAVPALNGRRVTSSFASATASKPTPGRDAETLEDADRRHIVAALERTNWVVAGPNGAAARLGIKRSTLQFRMRKLGIVRAAPPN
jgi:formate hydrogenlyase transcriptional activator